MLGKNLVLQLCFVYHCPSDLDNATIYNVLKALKYRKYQRRIHHAFNTLHPPRYLITSLAQWFKQISNGSCQSTDTNGSHGSTDTNGSHNSMVTNGSHSQVVTNGSHSQEITNGSQDQTVTTVQRIKRLQRFEM